MGAFQPFNLGDVLQNAEAIKGMQDNHVLQGLQREYLGQRMSNDAAQETRAATTFDEAQQYTHTVLAHTAAAEVAKDPSTAQRWDPVMAKIFPDWQPANGTPQQIQAAAQKMFESTGAAIQAHQAATPNSNDLPSNVREYQFYNALPPDKKQQYLEMKRTMNPFTEADFAGGKGVLDKRTGQYNAVTTAGQEAAGQSQVAGTTQGAKTTAEENTKRYSTQIDEGYRAADGIPIINRGLQLLDTVKTGGLNAAQLAASNLFGVTGADEAELSNKLGKAVLAQLRSTFGAQFTAAEGHRLADLEAGFSKSTEGNRRILEQSKILVQRVVDRGIAAAQRMGNDYDAQGIVKAASLNMDPSAQTGGAAPPPAQPVKIQSDADYAALPSGQTYIAPDGSVRTKK